MTQNNLQISQEQRYRIQENTSLRVLLVCLLALDISAVIGCVSAAVVTAILPSYQLPSDKVTMINMTILLGTYGFTSLLCNCFALHGLKKENRVFLVPYLVFLPLVLTSIVILIVKNILTRSVSPEMLFIPMAIGLILMIVWLKLVRHWFLMSVNLPAPSDSNVDIENLRLRGYNFITPRHRRAGVGANSSPDLPPAYDNVVALEDAEDTEERPVNKVEETPPPAYQDVIRIEDEIKQQ